MTLRFDRAFGGQSDTTQSTAAEPDSGRRGTSPEPIRPFLKSDKNDLDFHQ
jgi:hypothetical protein